jgi:hypothetical protein
MKSLYDHAVHTVMIEQRTIIDLASAERATLPSSLRLLLVAYCTSCEVWRAA